MCSSDLWNRLAGTDETAILAAVTDSLRQVPAAHPELYGGGRAAPRIVEVLGAGALP